MPSATTIPSTPSAPARARRTSTARCGQPLVGQQPAPRAGPPAPRAGPPCRPAPRTRPASGCPARRAERRRGRGPPAATPRPGPRPAPPPRPGPHPGRRRPGARRTATSGSARPAAPRGVGAPRTGDERHAGRLVVGHQQRLDLVPRPDGLVELLDHPPRVGVRDGQVARPVVVGGPAPPGRPSRPRRARRPAAAPRSRIPPRPARRRSGPARRWSRSRRAAGTRIASSWWVPRRSASSTRACTFAERPVDARRQHGVVQALAAGPSRTSARSRTPRRGRSARAASGPRAARGWCRRRRTGQHAAPRARRYGPRQPRCSLTELLGRLGRPASVMISSSSWRVSSPSRDCWTSTAL